MRKGSEGWWYWKCIIDTDYFDYYFSIDGSEPLPDPMSVFQPKGVHGPSRYIDHSFFQWEDTGFTPTPLSSAIIYELHIGTFTPNGTFFSCIEKLDYLKKLGITHIELMPVAEFSGTRGWGYDCVDLFAPHHSYGGPEGLKQLINKSHKKGIAVILDVVYNHLGPEGNYLNLFGPYFTEKYKTPWGMAVNFDGHYSNEVRKFFINSAIMWFTHFHIDGLRLDAVHSIHDMSALHFLEELAGTVKQLEPELGKDLVLIAESDLNAPRFVQSPDTGGYGLDAQWNDDFHHALHSILTGENNGYYSDFGALEHLVKAFTDIFVYIGQYSYFRKKNYGKQLKSLLGDRFVVYAQNHDQVGNRAKGDRLHFLISIECVKIAAALVLTSPFIPMIFQGEEWGASTPFMYFTDHQDPDLIKAVREGRQKEFIEFGWNPEEISDPQDLKTFTSSRLRWEEQSDYPHNKMLDWYKQMISLRKKHKDLSCGNCSNITIDFSEKNKWIHIKRDKMSIICNFSNNVQKIPCKKNNPEIVATSTKGVQLHK